MSSYSLIASSPVIQRNFSGLQTALAELSPAQREVVLLHDMEGWKHREIAERLGLSEVASRQHLFNARRALREGLGGRNVLREYANED